jgi:putative transposase
LPTAYAVISFRIVLVLVFWDETHLLAAARYVELNPVKAGMVRSAEEYPWSSARFHLGLVANDVLVKDKNLLGLVENWEGYL